MSRKTSSRSTLTTVPSTMSPSLKYLMVRSIAARNDSSDPMSLTATLGVEVACVLLVMCGLAPDADRMKEWTALRANAALMEDRERAGPPGRVATLARPGGQRAPGSQVHEPASSKQASSWASQAR